MKFSPKAILLDAYGTLLDVYSVGQMAETLFPGHGDRLARMWRDKQVDYTRLRSMAGRYKPFEEITRDALEFCGEALGLSMQPSQVRALMDQYGRLSAFPENAAVLSQLRAAGHRLAIHTNANPEMIAQAVQSAGLSGLFDTVLSAHTAQRYKIDAEVYRLAIDHFGCRADEMLFVSSNGWDACGATWFGFTTFWVNRSGAPRERLDVAPSYEGKSLVDVAKLVCS